MTLFDLFQAASRLLNRHPFPVYVELHDGERCEIERVDVHGGCAGVVLIPLEPLIKHVDEDWDDELSDLAQDIADSFCHHHDKSDVWHAFNPTGSVPSIEDAYRLLLKTQALLERMYE